MGEHQGCRVAVKVLKPYLSNDFDKVTSVGCLCGVLNTRIGKLTMPHVEVLQRSYDMENPSPSECITAAGSDNGR